MNVRPIAYAKIELSLIELNLYNCHVCYQCVKIPAVSRIKKDSNEMNGIKVVR